MNPFHRILLHLACLLRRPTHWRFHFHGLGREVHFSLPKSL